MKAVYHDYQFMRHCPIILQAVDESLSISLEESENSSVAGIEHKCKYILHHIKLDCKQVSVSNR